MPLQPTIDSAWNNLVTSTHHDYITGTATDYVYRGALQSFWVYCVLIAAKAEQLPLGAQTLKTAVILRNTAVQKIASALPAAAVLSTLSRRYMYMY